MDLWCTKVWNTYIWSNFLFCLMVISTNETEGKWIFSSKLSMVRAVPQSVIQVSYLIAISCGTNRYCEGEGCVYSLEVKWHLQIDISLSSCIFHWRMPQWNILPSLITQSWIRMGSSYVYTVNNSENLAKTIQALHLSNLRSQEARKSLG